MQIKTAALIGLGAIGSFIAPRLNEALGPGNFKVVAKGACKHRLLEEGTTINGTRYVFDVADPSGACEPVDLVIVLVKHNALPQAVQDIRPLVGPDTVIVSFMNGITSEETLAEAYGWPRVIYGLSRVSVVMENHTSQYDPENGFFLFGEACNRGARSPRIAALAELFDRAGIHYQVPEDMVRALWLKFMANVSENQTSAVLGIPFGAWQVSDEANALREDTMREVIAIAQKKGIDIGEQDMLDQRAQLQRIPYPNKTSMLQDLEHGRPTEVEMLAGTVIRLGRELGVPTPINQALYHAIKVLEEKNEGKI